MLNDLLQAALFLIPIGAGVGALVILGRDRDGQADEHDLADYQEPAPVADGPERRRLRPAMVLGPRATVTPLDPLTAPIDALPDAGPLIWEQMTAARFLRELGEEARARLEPAR